MKSSKSSKSVKGNSGENNKNDNKKEATMTEKKNEKPVAEANVEAPSSDLKKVVNYEITTNGSSLGLKIDFEGDVSYRCIFKADLKGIAAEKFITENLTLKIGMANAEKEFGIDSRYALTIRKELMRKLRGDEDKTEKVKEFEIGVLKQKIEKYEQKIDKLRREIEDIENKPTVTVEVGDLNIDKLKEEAKQKAIEALKAKLASLED